MDELDVFLEWHAKWSSEYFRFVCYVCGYEGPPMAKGQCFVLPDDAWTEEGMGCPMCGQHSWEMLDSPVPALG